MRLTGILFAAIAAVTLLANGAMAADRYGKQKVVYHINYNGGDKDKAYVGAMRNIQNHINAVGAENLDVKVVLHGNGLGLLQHARKSNEKLKGAVASLKSQNVAFQVCNNTLKGRKISYENDLFDVYKEDIVPSGVAELTHLQQQGYTYIKP
ncbi:MAG: DsrE family protein [Rhodospirillaceae bacterium]